MAQIDNLPPLRDVVRVYGLNAKKNLGQNFLFDLNLTSRIVRASGSLEGHVILEVGAGPGGLTRAILATGAQNVIAIERDSRCIPALQDIASYYPNCLTLINEDALKFDPVSMLAGKKAKIIANLPYNVGTTLLIHWLLQEPWPPWWASLTLMFQKEVAERIVATHETPKDYGRLGVLAGWRCEASLMFDVPPSAFIPQPKVISSVVHLVPRSAPLPCDVKWLEIITRAAFGQRRKMLRQSLKSLHGDAARLIRQVGLDETMRAEEVSVPHFIALANAFKESGALFANK